MNGSFLFLADLNGHHQEWLGSTATNRHGIRDCVWLPSRGGTLDHLIITHVPDL